MTSTSTVDSAHGTRSDGEPAVFTSTNQNIAAGLLLLGILSAVALAGVEDAISGARLNFIFGPPTLAYKVRVAGAASAEFLLLAVPGLLLVLRGYRVRALMPLALITLGRAAVPFDPGFEASLAVVLLVLAAAPVVWLVRTSPVQEHPRLPGELWVLFSVAFTGVLVWYVEVIFSPAGRLIGAPAGYAAFLVFGLLLGAPRGWWLMAHGLLLGLALTANGITYGWMASSLPLVADPWGLASAVGPVMAGVVGSAVHRLHIPDTSRPLMRRAV